MRTITLFLLTLLAKFSTGTLRLSQNDFTYYKACYSSSKDLETELIEQRVNNFDPQDERTWQMRYLETNKFLGDGGPIFIYVGGKWTIEQSKGAINAGHMQDMARDLNGTIFFPEHRFYGKSQPFENFTVENLEFLSIDQALADLANFIVHIKKTIPEVRNSGVILVGCSHGATLATFFMQKYPHLANGAWASSGPLEAKLSFPENDEIIKEAIEHFGGKDCTRKLRLIYQELEKLLNEQQNEKIKKLLKLCDDFNSTKYGSYLFCQDKIMFSSFVKNDMHDQIRDGCEIVTKSSSEDALENFMTWKIKASVGDSENLTNYCFDHKLPVKTHSDNRFYNFQFCNELGWFNVASEKNIFPPKFSQNINDHIARCQKDFGSKYTAEFIQEKIEQTNAIHGGKKPNVTNVYSTQGQFDPMRPAGVQEDINESSPTVVYPELSYCSDFRSISVNDTKEVRASKERIFKLVKKWLGRND